MAAGRPFIPEHIDELTPEWIGGVLRERGFVDRARVVGVEREILGDGEGFLGVIARLALRYDVDEPGAPASVVAKLPQAANRAMGELLGAYERESLFYEDLARLVPLRTPGVFYSAFDRDRGSEQQQKILAFADRLPVSFTRATLGAGKWIAARKKRRYILLMEDMAPARPGDQISGGDVDDCKRLLTAVASAHAAFWGGNGLDERFWLLPMGIDVRMRYGMFRTVHGRFRRQYPDLIEAGLGRAVDWLLDRGLELSRTFYGSAPDTIVHCDLRLDNVFFESDGSPVVFDWQLVRRGPAAYDVAYFLGGALDPATDAATEREILTAYHDALVDAGVTDYGFDDLHLDYQRGLMANLQTLSNTDDMELGDDRGARMMDLWIERLAGRIAGVDLDALL